MKTIVVGGGLSGLSFAHRLLELEPDADLLVLEGSATAGGLLGTIERDDMVIETGPDSILSNKPACVQLAARLGIQDRLIETNEAHRGAYVVNRGRLERLPAGFSLMAPARMDTWAKSPILSVRGRLRGALEPLFPVRRGKPEESMAHFVRRRLGNEVFDRLAQPMVGGIYGGDPDRLSLAATMPRFLDLEAEHGSVVRGLRAQQKKAREQATGARYGMFVAFDRGMKTLIDALRDRLGERVRTQTPVSAIEHERDGWRVRAGDETLIAERLVLALPAWRAALLLEPHHAPLSGALRSIRYGSAATVTFSWPRKNVPHELDAFGFVVPTVERRSVLAATFSSVKWKGRAPLDTTLLRVFVGGTNAPDAADLTDAALIGCARRELLRLMGIADEPTFSIVRRYKDAMPQYQLRHLERVAAIEEHERDVPGLVLVGNAYRGVGIPDSVRYAEEAAERLLRE